MEIWKDIPGYEGIYQVSNLGQIKSLKRLDRRGHKWREKILSPAKTPNGYYQVILARDRTNTKRYVHHIVTDVFLGPCPAGKERNHKNGDKSDNSIGNLEYCTSSENHYHSYRVLGKQAASGSRKNSTRLTIEQVKRIRNLYKDGITSRELAKIFLVSVPHIRNIIGYRTWIYVE